MRKYNSKNQIWYDENDESVRIGFTQSFLDTLDQCWHILPSNTERFKLKAPLLTVETNDALISIMSPVAGNFMNYSDKAQNFPDRLIESDVIMELSLKPVIRPQVARQQVQGGPPELADWHPAMRGEIPPVQPRGQVRGAAPLRFNIDNLAEAVAAPLNLGQQFRNDWQQRIAEQAQAHQAEALHNINRNG